MQRDKVADELATLPADAEIREFIKDYAVLRDQTRACQQHN